MAATRLFTFSSTVLPAQTQQVRDHGVFLVYGIPFLVRRRHELGGYRRVIRE